MDYSEDLGPTRSLVDIALARISGQRVLSRLWASDHTLWKPTAENIENQLGWLIIPRPESGALDLSLELVKSAQASGFRRAVLLGIGDACSVAKVFRETFGVAEGFLDLVVFDTTNPSDILDRAASFVPDETLWIVCSKSGKTPETLALLKYFYRFSAARLGEVQTSKHFVAITDPHSPLDDLAKEWQFRSTIHSYPEISGPFAALSPVGFTSAALIGLDIKKLLQNARKMARQCGPEVPEELNHAARLGVTMAELARTGRDKLTLIIDESLGSSFGVWLEHLIAVTTGKEGKGILPVVGEAFNSPSAYGPDRFFISLCTEEDEMIDCDLRGLRAAGHPVIRMKLTDQYDLGGQFILWELAAAVTCHVFQVNPFSQPDLDASRKTAQRLVSIFKESGEFSRQEPVLADDTFTLYGDAEGATPLDAILSFLKDLRPPAYLSILAYLPQSFDNNIALQLLRMRIRDELGLAVTVNSGPQYLHSTGQLHLGNSGQGRYLVLTADDDRDVPVPDEVGFQQGVISFGVLKTAQALSDLMTLRKFGRRVMHIHLGNNLEQGLELLTGIFDSSRTSTTPPIYSEKE